MAGTGEEIYRERLKRVEDAISLKVPDRVPFFPLTHFFAAKYTGMNPEEAYYHTDRWVEANKTMFLDLQPDLYYPAAATSSGHALDILDCMQIKWPGHGISSSNSASFQFVEGEYMKAHEYDQFLADPSDYIIRIYMPRVFGSLEPLSNLPSIQSLFIHGYKGAIAGSVLADPTISKAFESLYKAGLEASRYLTTLAGFDRDMQALGFPKSFSINAYVPYDIISDMLRGMRGTMLDMYRQPDKLLETMERLFPMLLKGAVEGAKKTGNPRVFIPLHRGSDGFMSLKQFERFYWPWFKRLVQGLIDQGLTPCPFFEGDYTTRLEYLRELPKGKVMGIFDSTDIFRAKEIVGDILCIAGNMPVSLLCTGTPDQVREHTTMLIDIAGKGGGFIMSSRSVLDDARPELVRVWADCTREYGIYT